MLASRWWVWFESSRRWVSASEAGARRLAVDEGREVGWGPRAPHRAGVDLCGTPPAWRAHLWAVICEQTSLLPGLRSRLSSIA